MGRIFVTGDCHNDNDTYKIDNFDGCCGEAETPSCQHPTEDDYLIICGDWGGIWFGDNANHMYDDEYMINYWKDKKYTTIVILGNHENYDYIEKTYPISEWNGAKVRKIADNIIVVERGQIFEIEGKKFFCFGGAQSHDMWCRTQDINWWDRELPSEEEYEEGLNNLKSVNYEVDYVITHCICDHIQNLIGRGSYEHDKLTNYLEVVSKDLKFSKWYFGHYHHDVDYSNWGPLSHFPQIDPDEAGKYTCLYHKVLEIE